MSNIIHHLVGGVYAKETRIPAGKTLVQHKHKYDHLSVLASGSVIVDFPEMQITYNAPAVITIRAGRNHGVRALTDAVWLCVHASSVADDDALIGEASSDSEVKSVMVRLTGG